MNTIVRTVRKIVAAWPAGLASMTASRSPELFEANSQLLKGNDN